MSGWLSRLFDTSAVPQDYTAPANQLGPLARQVMANPVGTETTSPYASQSVGVPSGPFNPIEAMTPNGPMLGTDVDRAHEIVRQGIQEYAPTLLGMVGDAPGGKAPGFTAYHGSPHDFSAFDTSKIGTGEGAQAYGHGLYFAENEGIARGYRDKLAPSSTVSDLIDKHGGDANAAFTDLINQGYTSAELDAMSRYMRTGERPPKGSMYEVNVNADPAHFLDWDKPLSEQSPHVQQALQTHAELGGRQNWDDRATGQQIYKQITDDPTNRDAAGMLRFLGIPGIRYLDAGSRNTPNLTVIPPQQSYAGRWTVQDPVFRGNSKHFDTEADAQAYVKSQSPPSTYNHVVFDANTIDILRKYGIAGLLGGTGAVAGTQQPSQ